MNRVSRPAPLGKTPLKRRQAFSTNCRLYRWGGAPSTEDEARPSRGTDDGARAGHVSHVLRAVPRRVTRKQAAGSLLLKPTTIPDARSELAPWASVAPSSAYTELMSIWVECIIEIVLDVNEVEKDWA